MPCTNLKDGSSGISQSLSSQYEGADDGEALGTNDTLGTDDGINDGIVLGLVDGIKDGLLDGTLVGFDDGSKDGIKLGIDDGIFVGNILGIKDGEDEGRVETWCLEVFKLLEFLPILSFEVSNLWH